MKGNKPKNLFCGIKSPVKEQKKLQQHSITCRFSISTTPNIWSNTLLNISKSVFHRVTLELSISNLNQTKQWVTRFLYNSSILFCPKKCYLNSRIHLWFEVFSSLNRWIKFKPTQKFHRGRHVISTKENWEKKIRWKMSSSEINFISEAKNGRVKSVTKEIRKLELQIWKIALCKRESKRIVTNWRLMTYSKFKVFSGTR